MDYGQPLGEPACSLRLGFYAQVYSRFPLEILVAYIAFLGNQNGIEIVDC